MPAVSPAEIDRERAHLERAREELARMRERTAGLTVHAGDRISAEALERTLARRLAQLADDPHVPLFFGRLDHDEPSGGKVFHVGRRHVSDTAGDPLVVDWRAPVSAAFYRATRDDPMGVTARRRYGFARGVLTGFEDEALSGAAVTEAEHSEILEQEIERPRTGPMRDIVATIQPEQDVIVRSGLDRTVVVQGAPGTGKTAVGLHRAAYLLYAHREQVTRRGMIVVGPNSSFLRYIRDVLPALGEVDARQTTVEEMVAAHGRLRGAEPAEAARLKGDARMAQVLRRAVWSHLGEPGEALVLPRGSRRWRVPTHEARDAVAHVVGRDLRYDAGREQLRYALAHRILQQIEASGDALDDRAWDVLARTRAVKDYAATLWPILAPARLLHRLLADAEFLAEMSDGILTPAERQTLAWAVAPRSAGAARWTLADLVLLDELADLLERAPSVAHVVVDEAQDLSPMMLRALGRRARTGSLTVLGDLAQATTPWAVRSWADALHQLGKPDGHVEQLTAGFRVPGDVIEYAARLLPTIAPELAPPVAVRRARGELLLTTAPTEELVRAALARDGSVGLIVPDAGVDVARRRLLAAGLEFAVVGEEDVRAYDQTGAADAADDQATEFDARLDLVPASLAKGLEFDHVVLDDPAGIVAGETEREPGLRRLYVCLTRAVTSLAVRHDDDVPPELAA
ncbi:HelD family protein [Krasilnikoviella flava]|uniref:DNA helicase IV n=1 Tax=Krasilnikoviella flava TaxID=526729 RepID=A0A1T5J976_9MICO|nr:AAA family ATPase [Krasilnikoviella flava]SKC47793.1 DNA helicase IV [Krasilnikoviella flava]